MADERKIVIVLRTEGGTSGGERTGEKQDAIKAITPEEEKGSVGQAIAAMAAFKIAEATTSEVLNWGNYLWDRKLTLTDDYVGQRQKNIALQLMNKGMSIAGNIFSLTAYGAMIGGPLGGAFGAAIGTVISIASVARENAQAYEQQEIQLRQMNAQLGYTRQRAGWSTTAASIGEDL